MTLEELKTLVDSKKQQVVINKGVTPISLLGVAFVILKLMGYITWSWWWVLAPFWIPFCIAIGLILVCLLLLVIASVVYKKQPKVTAEKKEEPKEEKKSVKKTTTKKAKADGATSSKNK